MSEYYCHSCAGEMGLMNPASPLSLTGTDYQLGKFIKHTDPTGTYPINSVFGDTDYGTYENYVVSSAGSGFLELDDRGRRNIVWVAGKTIGATYKNGIYTYPDDAVRIVLHDNQWKIHAFPTLSDKVQSKRCKRCGVLVTY